MDLSMDDGGDGAGGEGSQASRKRALVREQEAFCCFVEIHQG
jgi:hypothetical protein